MFRLKFSRLELDHHVATQLHVVEQQINEELIATHIQENLLADERKTSAQLQHKVGDVFDQGIFYVALLRIQGQTEKIKTIRIFQRLTRQRRIVAWAGGFRNC